MKGKKKREGTNLTNELLAILKITRIEKKNNWHKGISFGGNAPRKARQRLLFRGRRSIPESSPYVSSREAPQRTAWAWREALTAGLSGRLWFHHFFCWWNWRPDVPFLYSSKGEMGWWQQQTNWVLGDWWVKNCDVYLKEPRVGFVQYSGFLVTYGSTY